MRPRFIFHGHAAAFGGRIVRPKDVVLESSATCSLPVTGGRSAAAARAITFGRFVKIGAASAMAEGAFDDREAEIAMTHGRVHPGRLATTTTVRADVRDAIVGTEPQFRVRRVVGALTATSPHASGEPAIQLDDATSIERVTIGRSRLIVEFNRALFRKYDTRSKLLAASDDPRFVREHGECLFIGPAPEPQPGAPAGRSIGGRTTIYATIVKSLRWDGRPFPGARINRHAVTVPELGTIYFGEILITRSSRRLTMIRMDLGSDTGGSCCFSDVQDNGSWSG